MRSEATASGVISSGWLGFKQNEKENMKTKYLICPGKVQSKNDGGKHYVGVADLMRLYRVDPYECEVLAPDTFQPEHDRYLADARRRGLIELRPKYDGNYELPNSQLT